MNVRAMIGVFAAVSTAAVFAQDPSQSDFDRFKKEQEQGIQQQEESFRRYSAAVTRQFQQYTAEQERLFRDYSGQIEKKWGKKQTKTSTKEEYISYAPDFSSRRAIDYEKGSASVEILVSEAEAKDPARVQEALKQQVAQLVSAKGGTDPLEVKNGIPPQKTPIISGQLAAPNGSPVTEKNAAPFAEDAIRKAEVTQQVVTGKDGIRRVVIGVQLPLVPDHVKRRAAEFRSSVQQQSVRFNVDVTLIYAVMHTESYFNPRARSAVPAFGLMQLVPRSGARDAYFFAHRKDSLVTGEYLYVPENNVELGTAYLAKLMTVEFRGVTDPKSRIFCAIAAYNTGPGNVAKAFTGKRNVIQALPKINSMTSDQVFAHLRSNLPFEETRSYVTKVSERMGLYHEWSKE